MGGSFVCDLHPLSKVFATVPAIAVILFVPDHYVPFMFLLTAIVLLTFWGNLVVKRIVMLYVGLFGLLLFLFVWFTVLQNSGVVVGSSFVSLFGFTVYREAAVLGFAASLRIVGLLYLIFLSSFTTDSKDLVIALMQYFRLPYRLGYVALASLQFLPLVRREAEAMRISHSFRYSQRRPGVYKRFGYGLNRVVLLFVATIRFGQRVAVTMDSRAFGAFGVRRESKVLVFVFKDWVFLIFGWVFTVFLLFVRPFSNFF